MRYFGHRVLIGHLIVKNLCQKIDKQMTAFNVKDKKSFSALCGLSVPPPQSSGTGLKN